ncbi:MAG: HAD-IA family hydrolase [Ornithinibacter sp.]
MPAPATAFDQPFSAVLLDMDGTLIDSMPAVERSWLRWSEEFDVDPQLLGGLHGVPAVDVVRQVLPEERRGPAFARIRELEASDTTGITVLPGAAELLATLAAGDVPTAIVTSCTRELAEARIAATGLVRPHVVVTASDVRRGKPSPDPWLEGAGLLGVDPRDCVVVEDAVAGLAGARDAGCRGLVAVTTTTARELLMPLSDLVVHDLEGLSVEVTRSRVRIQPGASAPSAGRA